jgi:hypothetical protein
MDSAFFSQSSNGTPVALFLVVQKTNEHRLYIKVRKLDTGNLHGVAGVGAA